MSSMQELWNTSYLSGNSMEYIGGLFEDYLTDPNSVPKDWQQFFDEIKKKGDENISYQSI